MYNPVAELLCGILGILIIIMSLMIIGIGLSMILEYTTGIVIISH